MNCNNAVKAVFFSLCFFYCLITHIPAAFADKLTISGKVTDAQNGEPLPVANVLVKPGNTGTTTNDKGVYNLTLLPGKYTLVVTFIGYDTTTQKINIIESQPAPKFNFKLNPRILPGRELTVTAQGFDPEITKYEIRGRELQRMPSPLPDALNMIKTLPGVSSLNDQSSFYNIRGGSYDENLIYINGIEIYQPHIVRKGIMENPSLVNAELVQNINLRTGAFPVQYGDKLSSVLDVTYMNNIDKTRAMVDISTIGINTALQMKINKQLSVLVGLRKINYSFLLDHLAYTETDYQPDYNDAQAILYFKPTQNFKLSLMGIYADSKYLSSPQEWYDQRRWEFYVKGKYSGNEKLHYNTSLWALTTEHKINNFTIIFRNSIYKQKEEEKTNLNGNVYISNDFQKEPDETLYDEKNTLFHKVNNSYAGTIYSSILSADYSPAAGLVLKTGVDYKLFQNNSNLYEKHIIQPDSGVKLLTPDFNYDRKVNLEGTLLAGFIHASIQATPRLLLQPGIRVVTSSLNNETLALPRLSVFYDINKSMQILFAAGRYAQPPTYKEFQFRPFNNTELLAQKATMVTLGIQQEYPANKGYKIEFYYKDLQDIISYEIRDVRSIYSGMNDAKGYVYGLDAYLHFQYPGEAENWFSYSYLLAREKLLNSSEGYVPRPTDRRHQVTMYMEDEMQKFKNSRYHIRLVLGSPYPHTWQRWAMNAETGGYEYQKGSRNHGRLTTYRRIDMGCTQEFKIKGAKLVLREEVLNMFNNINLLGYDVMFDTVVHYYMSGRIYNIGFRVEL